MPANIAIFVSSYFQRQIQLPKSASNCMNRSFLLGRNLNLLQRISTFSCIEVQFNGIMDSVEFAGSTQQQLLSGSSQKAIVLFNAVEALLLLHLQ
jgi:hypothetical protein